MVKNGEMSLNEREKALSKLLADAKKLNFSKHLVESYDKQLSEIREELKEIKQKQEEFMKMLKSKTQ